MTIPLHSLSPATDSTAPGWIVSPWFDLLFLVNATWPLFFLIAFSGEGFDGRDGIKFWQVFFVTTPHRWITLFFVFLDRDRLKNQTAMFGGLAMVVFALCSITLLTTGTLFCLLAVDYLWNAWHFAAQHHGVYRLFDRAGNIDPATVSGRSIWPFLEKILMRFFLLFVTARVAGGTWSNSELEEWLLKLDWVLLVAPAALLAGEALKPGPKNWGRKCYLLSVMSLYTCLLWAVHNNHPRAVLALTTASALFHATEYLALVSWSVHQRDRTRGSQLGWLHWFAGRWSLTLAAYIAILGIGGWLIEQKWIETWLFLNVIVAFLHYAYDGIIWKRPKKRSSNHRIAQHAEIVKS
ncbi:MAG: hypothetical protein JWM11_7745 [Planctomycetaceae bacterium]|nr:hypothetical protein [Planctomycetaceae bacterium]